MAFYLRLVLTNVNVSKIIDAVHLLFGVAGLALAKTADGARNFLIGGGVAYLVLWLLGFVASRGTMRTAAPA